MKNLFKNAFTHWKDGLIKLSINGEIAVCNQPSREYKIQDQPVQEYKIYDINTHKLINCDNFCLEMPENSFYNIPTKLENLKIGDTICYSTNIETEIRLFNVYCITNITNDKIIAINYMSGKEETLCPEYYIFMKNTAYILKIVNIYGNIFNFNNINDNNMTKYLMLSQMTNGEKNNNMNPIMLAMLMNEKDNKDDNNMMKYLMVSQMIGKNNTNMLPMLMLMNEKDNKDDNMMKYLMLSQMNSSDNNMNPMMLAMLLNGKDNNIFEDFLNFNKTENKTEEQKGN